ncbi:glycine zipper family protein [Vibrio parahaemolyticus]|nr:glycine zipper family protein [Vibrio parahaemolyticus]
MYKPLLLVVLSSSLAACAYNQKPVVDMTNVDQAQYEQDFAYCQGYAEKVDKTEAAKSEATNGAMTGALIGAAAGALGGANDSTKTQALVLRKCLQNKGYTVYDLD